MDPVLEQCDRDLALLQDLGLTLKFCLETHLHADHITAAGRLRELTGCETVVPAGANATCADRFVVEGDRLQVGSIAITVIETRGHTDSHAAYLIHQAELLTGDSLLIRGCGRTDFQSGDAGQLFDSVQRLFQLPDNTRVWPGHDYRGHTVSTIGEEKRLNRRFVGRDRQSFITFMNSLDLPDPQRIMEAVPANERCGHPATS